MINDLRNIVKKFIGIDIGGTGIKGVIINGLGNVLAEGSVPTDADKGEEAMMSNIVDLINSMLSSVDIVKREISGIGIGCPGLIDSKNGMVEFEILPPCNRSIRTHGVARKNHQRRERCGAR